MCMFNHGPNFRFARAQSSKSGYIGISIVILWSSVLWPNRLVFLFDPDNAQGIHEAI
jgi:hypothetical protein